MPSVRCVHRSGRYGFANFGEMTVRTKLQRFVHVELYEVQLLSYVLIPLFCPE